MTHLLRGRDVELVTIGEHLDRLLSGLGAVLIVEGGAGMGKTRLLDEAARMARRLAIRVGRGLADPGGTVVPLSPLIEALFDGPGPVLGRDSLRDTHASPEQRYWLLQDIEALLERAALDAPVLICLDDLQWADSGTAAALRVLPGRLSSVPVGWVVALRPHAATPQLSGALDHLERNGADRIVLRPLDHAAVAQVAADVLLAPPDDTLLEMIDRAGGSPFLLAELLTGLREERIVRVESGRAELAEARLPRRVSDSMRKRLGRLSDQARQIETAAASLGRRFGLSDVAAMLDLPATALLTPVEELIHSDLLTERDDQLGFPHDLTLEAVRASVPISVRRALDRQAALVLLAGGALPVEVALQLAASAEPGDEKAITTLLKASEALGPTDPSAAADLSQHALDLCPNRHPLRGPLVAGTAVWLHAAGRATEAKAFADTALRQVLPAEQEGAVRLSIAGMFSISPDVRADECREALALPGLSADLRARHLAFLFHNLVTAGRTDQARTVLPEATAAVRQNHHPAGTFVLELAESGLAYADGRFDPALEQVEAALRSSLNAGDDTRAHLTRQWRCDVLTMLDRFDEATQLTTDNIAAAHRDRQGWALHTYETGRARQLLQIGRLADATAVLSEQFSPDTAHEVVSVMDAAGVVAMGRAAIHRGDHGHARRAAEIARAMMSQAAPSVRRHASWLLSLLALADGQPARAHEWLSSDGEKERFTVVPLFPMDVTDDVRLVHIALAAGDLELATQASESAACRSRLNPDVRSIAAAAAHATGLLKRSLVDLARAIELFEAGPRPLALAAALEDFGVVSVDRGATEAGVEALDRALNLFAQAGASWDAARARGRLRALGIRRRLVGPPRLLTGWGALTDSELEVARLVSRGFTNREAAERLFVSHYTISGHLRSIFTKLNVNSRVELTRLVGAHDSDL